MRLAFVAPFFGAHAAGGAEAECRQTALRLAQRGHEIEIFTTCLRDLQHDWNVDAHAAGISSDGPLTVRRYRSDPVDIPRFAKAHEDVMRGNAADESERCFAAHHINSSSLYRDLAAREKDYDRLIFIPYLFGTTLYGSRIAPDKTILIPCLHDEPYARIAPVRELFERCARIVFHVPSEARLARELYGDTGDRGVLLGEGVDTGRTGDAERFRKTYGVEGDFLLSCGRKDPGKNTDGLLRAFAASRSARERNLKLVLLGPGSLPIPDQIRDRVIDPGFVSAQHKFDAYAACSVFVQPSRNESFSIVLMEAWDQARPVLVNGECEVLRDHAVRSGGGLYYRTDAEFDAALEWMFAHPASSAEFGLHGRAYVRGHFAWDIILDRFEREVLA